MTTTIGITAYNHERYIAECIESALAAPSVAEVIVVDDCSTDRTFDIATSYPIRVIRPSVNSGSAIAGLCKLIDEATSDRLMWLSGDDAVENFAPALMEQYDADWVFGDLTVVDEDSEPLAAWTYPNVPRDASLVLGMMLERAAQGLNVGLPIPTLASYRLSWLRSSPRPRDFDGWQVFGDTPTAIGWLKTGPSIARVPLPCVRYRRHSQGETFTADKTRAELTARIVEAIGE